MRTGTRSTIAAVLVLLAGCGGSSPNAPTTAAGGGESAESVTIDNFTFMPPELTISVGDTVTWANDQGAAHTVTADDGGFDSGNLAQGAEFTRTFDAAGTFAYHCTIHPSMIGAITVEG